MGLVVEADSTNEPWIRALMERHELLEGRTDVGIRYWTQDEWRDFEHLHQQHHRQQQQQEQQLRQQQHQRRQKQFRYRQQQQQQQQEEQHLHQQQHQQRQKQIQYRQQKQQLQQQQQQQQQQYHHQQQHGNYRRQQHQRHYQPETAKKTSMAQHVEARADEEAAPAEIGSAPPSSHTTLQPQSLCEYPEMLFASQPVCRKVLSTQDGQLKFMENGMLQPPQEPEENKRQLQALQLQQPSAPRELGAKSGDDRVGCVADYDTAHARGEHETLPRRQQPIPQADEKFLVLAQMSSDNMLVEEELYLVVEYDETVAVGDGLLILAKGEKEDGSLVFEDGEQVPPPLLLQQQELLAPTHQEP